MAKDPAFLFYPNDWIGGTMGMSFEEKGIYMEVLMMQFNRGHMTEDMIRHTVGQGWRFIQHKFVQDEEGLWYNVRLQEEQIKRKSYTQSRSNNKSGTNQHTKKDAHMTNHMSLHMEDENINVLNKENGVANVNPFWFLKFYNSPYEVYKTTFNGQSTSESNFDLWRKFIDLIYAKKLESIFTCKFLSPHSFAILVEKEKFKKEIWEETINKILGSGVEPKHDLFFRIPQFMKYGKPKQTETQTDVKLVFK